jgi:hypothetical protein
MFILKKKKFELYSITVSVECGAAAFASRCDLKPLPKPPKTPKFAPRIPGGVLGSA